MCKKGRIFLVDDHEAVRKGLTSLLRSVNPAWEVMEASSATEAIASIRASFPEVVLMDYMMPKIDGLQDAEELRKEWPDI